MAVFSGNLKIASQIAPEEATDKLCPRTPHLTLVVQTILLSILDVLHIHEAIDVETNTDLDNDWSFITQKLIIELNRKNYLIIGQNI